MTSNSAFLIIMLIVATLGAIIVTISELIKFVIKRGQKANEKYFTRRKRMLHNKKD